MTNLILIATITGYCACHKCCGHRAGGLTSSGHRPQQGITIAAPRCVPHGTKVMVANQTFTVQDRTARKFDGRWDIYFNRHEDAKRFGKQQRQITIKQ